uniref:A-kinase anchor protein 7-like phosphoesterase domain-containing protein n=1 Tax=Scylla olivacea TaxID=85551 RepID=A0A0P4WKE8_SCYOL
MKSHYAFVPLTTKCKEDLKEVQTMLLDDARNLNLRSSMVQDAHFTLSVYSIDKSKRKEGETEEQLIESVNELLKDFLQKRPPLELTFGGLGNFGTRMVFINLTNEEQLGTLRKDMNDLLQKEGIFITDNRFTPHVTLFREGSRRRFSKSSLTVQDLVSRKDIPPVTASPLTKIVFQKLRD